MVVLVVEKDMITRFGKERNVLIFQGEDPLTRISLFDLNDFGVGKGWIFEVEKGKGIFLLFRASMYFS